MRISDCSSDVCSSDLGAAYDKTRLAEYACVLGHAKAEGVGRGALAAYLDRYPGGLKGLVKDARARRKPADSSERVDEKLEALRHAHQIGRATRLNSSH